MKLKEQVQKPKHAGQMYGALRVSIYKSGGTIDPSYPRGIASFTSELEECPWLPFAFGPVRFSLAVDSTGQVYIADEWIDPAAIADVHQREEWFYTMGRLQRENAKLRTAISTFLSAAGAKARNKARRALRALGG